MSIKQQGGIFGRNPTFNDVDVEGTLTVDGLPVVGGTGTMASQDANAVAITGGAIDGTVIGGTTPATADFTTIDSTGLATLAALTVDTSTLFVDAVNNRVGLGTTNPSQRLDVSGNTRLVGSDPYVQALRTSDFYYGKLSADGFAAFTNINGSAPVILKTATTARLTVEAGGDVLLNTGNLKVQSGKGIDFSATSGTGTSELFDDYEEGTWTPELRFGNATTGITYDIQAGNYVKVGRQVTVSCQIDLSSKGTATGNTTIGGYPYSIRGDGSTAAIDTVQGFSSLVASGSTFLTVLSSTGYVMRQTVTGRSPLADTNFTDASRFLFSMIYITD